MKKTIRNPFVMLIVLVVAVCSLKGAFASAWTVNPADYRYDMSLYFELSFGNPAAWDAASDYEVAAFVGDECRGVSEILPNANDCLYMRIRSNEANGETVTFKLRKKGSTDDAVIEGVSMAFEADKAIGLPSDPYKLVVNRYFNVEVSAADGGSVSFENGRYAEGTELTAVANPDLKFRFVKWSDGDTNQERNIVVDGDLNITAEFEQNIFMLKYMVEGKEYNSFDLEVGAEIPAVEDPVKEGFKFNGWDGLPETMPANDVTVNALFLQYFKVNISAGEGGTVNFEAKEEGYLDGDEITVTATAADDKFRFVKWSDGVTEATRTISVNSNIDLVAEFEQYLYTITYKVEGKDYKTAKVEKGTAIPAVEDPVKEGFKFNGWEGLPETMPAEDITVNALFLQYFAVAITAGEGGSVDFEAKEGGYLEGDEITVTATAGEKFRFVEWSDGVKDNPRKITVAGNIDLSAKFEQNVFTITYMVDGEVYDTEDVEAGAKIEAKAGPVKEGYEFAGWEGLPETMPAKDVTVNATYTKYYTVDITAGNGGNVDFKNGQYLDGTEIEFTATAEGKYRFVKWSDGDTNATRKMTVVGDIKLSAEFEQYIFTLTYMLDGEVYKTVDVEAGAKIVAEDGPEKDGYEFASWEGLPETMPAKDVTVNATYTKYYTVDITAGNGGNVDFKNGQYLDGTEIEFTATADPKYRFVKWSDGDTNATRKITVAGDIKLSAEFEQYIFTLTYMLDGEVYKTVDVEAGAKIVAEDGPEKDGYEFASWEGLPETMPAKDVTVNATFTKYHSVDITAGNGGKVDFKNGQYLDGTEIEFTAVADPKYRFVKWSDGDTKATRNITVAGDIKLSAEFEQYVFTLTYMLDGEVYKTVDVEAGAKIAAVDAPEKEGYEFAGWDALPETMPAKDVTVNATFTQYHSVEITAGEGGKVEFKNGQYLAGTEIEFTAVADPKYRFVKWSDGDTKATRNITVAGDIKLSAEFEQYVFTLTYMLDGEVYKTVDVEAGAKIAAVDAPEKEGYEFAGWDALPETMPAKDVTVNATFTQYHSVEITAGEGGKVEFKNGQYLAGTEIEFTAVADPKYRFVKWSDGDTKATRNITVAGDIKLSAEFEQYVFTLTYMLDGEVYKTVDVEAGAKIVAEDGPEKDGYEFASWEGLPETMPAKDVTVNATFTKYHSVDITAGNGGNVDFKNGQYLDGTEIEFTATADAKYRFVKWSDGDTNATRKMTVAGDIKLSAEFEQYVFTLTYMVDGEVYKAVDVEAGAKIEAKAGPVKDGYEFAGWEGLPEIMPAKDVTVNATYTKYYTVDITAGNGGNVDFKNGQYLDGTEIEFTATADAKYRFVKWSDGDTNATRKMTVAGDIKLSAEFEQYIFTLTYMVDGEVYKAVEVETGTEIAAVDAPEKEGYEFTGWANLPETMPSEDLTVEAEYTAILYNLTVYLDGDIFYTAQLEMGAPIEIPEVELPSNRVFDGWEEEIPATMPSHDVEIHGTTSVISGLTSIFTDENERLTVYNLRGILILKDVTIKEAAERLPKGMYIINGRKVAF